MRKVNRILSVVALSMGITLMVGCTEKPIEDTPVMQEVSKEVEIKEDVNSNDYTMRYTEYMKGIAEGIINSSTNLEVLSKAISAKPEIVNDAIFKEKLASTLEYLEFSHRSVGDITPPDAFITYHSLMLESLGEYSNGARLFADSTTSGNAELMDSSLAHLIVAINLNNQATNELSNISK